MAAENSSENIMRLGDINISRINLEPLIFVHDYRTKLFMQFGEILKNTQVGKDLVKVLNEDERVKKLNRKLISYGGWGKLFEVETLAMWFLWYANRVGQEQAQNSLDEFLWKDEIQVQNTLWVLGVEVDEAINIGDRYIIRPIDNMLDSRDKERFIQNRFEVIHQSMPMSISAVTCSCNIQKIYEDSREQNFYLSQFFKVSENLYEISLLLNVIDGISCLPYYSTSYVNDSTPFGPFSSSCGSTEVYDVIGFGTSKFSKYNLTEFNQVFSSFNRLAKPEKDRFRIILNRLSQSKRRMQIEDKILDLGIALEMMLLNDNRNNDQLSLSFRLRGSWFLCSTSQERLEIYKKLKDIYNYRSQVAHSGILCGGNEGKKRQVTEAFTEYQNIAGRICRKLIINGMPDWDRVVLDTI